MIIPVSAAITSLVDFLIALVILVGLLAWYQFWPDWRVLSLPFFMIMAMLAALGPGLLVAALNVKYRDFRYLVPFQLKSTHQDPFFLHTAIGVIVDGFASASFCIAQEVSSFEPEMSAEVVNR